MTGDKLRRGPWFEEEDEQLMALISVMGERRWDSIAKASGLRRSGKSCRLRWLNYLRPNLKRGRLSAEEENIVILLQQQWGNKWSKIARRLPGRTDNEIKNYWRSYLRKQAQQEQDDEKIINNPKQENYKEHDGSVWIKLDDFVDEIEGNTNNNIKDDFVNARKFSSSEVISSPYENRLSDWLFEQRDFNDHTNALDTSFHYQLWNSENSDYSLWQSSSSIW